MRSRSTSLLLLLGALGCPDSQATSRTADAGDAQATAAPAADSAAAEQPVDAAAAAPPDGGSSQPDASGEDDADGGAALPGSDDAGDGGGPAAEPSVATLAGSYQDYCGETLDGRGSAARLQYSSDLAVAEDGSVFFLEAGGLRKISPAGEVTTIAPISGTLKDGPLSSALLANPGSLALDAAGTLWITDQCTVRKLSAAGELTTVAGATPVESDATVCGFVDSDSARSAQFGYGGMNPIAVDAVGTVFVLDVANHALRKLDANGKVTTLAGGGEGEAGESGDVDGVGRAARFNGPLDLLPLADGSVLVADTGNGRIRKVSPSGEVSTFAGKGDFTSRDGTLLEAGFDTPVALALDGAGRVFVAELSPRSSRIRVIEDGEVRTYAGGEIAAVTDGPAVSARFAGIAALAAGPGGVLYVADTVGCTIRTVTP